MTNSTNIRSNFSHFRQQGLTFSSYPAPLIGATATYNNSSNSSSKKSSFRKNPNSSNANNSGSSSSNPQARGSLMIPDCINNNTEENTPGCLTDNNRRRRQAMNRLLATDLMVASRYSITSINKFYFKCLKHIT